MLPLYGGKERQTVSHGPKEVLGRQGIELRPPFSPENSRILTPEALLFVAGLEREFRGDREKALAKRKEVQDKIDGGDLPDFLPETKWIRESDWKVLTKIPKDLKDRRVEITGPVERKMMINAMNSGATDFMADSEDSLSPTGANILTGQENLFDLARRKISFASPEGKHYELKDKTATLMYRPRGLHLTDKHVLIDGKPVSASFLDAALYIFHNGRELQKQGTGVYLYLPKLQDHLEAQLMSNFLTRAQEMPGDSKVPIFTTVLIEHPLAAFQTNEILWQLRDFAVGLNCGRWDYLAGFIKTLRNYPEFTLPDRGQVTMETDFMNAYARQVIDTCHRRGVHAMGGMSAYLPVKDPKANEKAYEEVRKDKIREAKLGHDGTWVAHPGLVPVAREVFDGYMPLANQIDKPREPINITSEDLLRVPDGTITEEGLRTNIRVGLEYISTWLGGQGAVAIDNKMEDAATAEISRSQVWQWIHHKAVMDDGRVIDGELFKSIFQEEFDQVWGKATSEDQRLRIGQAGALFLELTASEECPEFFTTKAYELLE